MWLGIWAVAIALAIGLSVAAIAMQPKRLPPRGARSVKPGGPFISPKPNGG